MTAGAAARRGGAGARWPSDPGAGPREEASRCPRLAARMGGNFGGVAVGLRAAMWNLAKRETDCLPPPPKVFTIQYNADFGGVGGNDMVKESLSTE